jgi:UDP-N-acetylmuramate dehydrogenase
MNTIMHASLKAYNSFGIDVKAQQLICIDTVKEVKDLVQKNIFNSPFIVLGKGSNVLFTEDYLGTVLVILIKGREVVYEGGSEVLLRVGAGEDWDQFVAYCVEKEWFGVENLSLIPGSVGASAVQNIGAYGVEAKDVIESVECVDLETGEEKSLLNVECDFEYRGSIFKKTLAGKAIITHITFRLKKQGLLNTNYKDVEKRMSEMGVNVKTLSLHDLRLIICDIRNSKLPLPEKVGNAGSFFKNPIIPVSQFEPLQLQFPDIVCYPTSSYNKIKISAAWLIDQAGYKGWKSENGNYGGYPNHALVLVNWGNAKGLDILRLSQDIAQKVKTKYGVALDTEVIII